MVVLVVASGCKPKPKPAPASAASAPTASAPTASASAVDRATPGLKDILGGKPAPKHQPMLVVPQGERAAETRLAAVGKNLYWVEARRIVRLAKGGGSAETVASANSPSSFVVDAENVYWTEDRPGATRILRAPSAGGEPTILADNQPYPSKLLAHDDSSLYLRSNKTARPGNDQVLAISKKGSAAPRVVWNGFAFAVAVDATDLFVGSVSTLMRVPKSGATPVELAKTTNVRDITLDKATVYWVDGGPPGRIQSIPKVGGEAATLGDLGMTELPDLVQVAAGNIYFTSNFTSIGGGMKGGKALMRTTAGKTVLLAGFEGQSVTGLAVDGPKVYVTANRALYTIPSE
jgi:hypothetical protein